MNKYLLLLIIAVLTVSCESQEDKIQKAISQELRGTLYDFESYEPVKTQIDSAFFSPSIDSELISLILNIGKTKEEFEEAKGEYNEALVNISLWDGSDAYNRQLRKDAEAKRDIAKRKIEKTQITIGSTLKDVCALIYKDESQSNKFVGWFVTQRYKCRTAGGFPTFGDDIFVFNEDMTECLLHMPKESYERICDTVDEMLTVSEEEMMQVIDNIDILTASLDGIE